MMTPSTVFLVGVATVLFGIFLPDFVRAWLPKSFRPIYIASGFIWMAVGILLH